MSKRANQRPILPRRCAVPWDYEFEERARDALLRLPSRVQKDIIRYLDERVTSGEPTRFGKPLLGALKGRWRWRVGDYRILGKVVRERLIVLVVDVGHRSRIYD
jgi:mRNA interferase RelE/StbE